MRQARREFGRKKLMEIYKHSSNYHRDLEIVKSDKMKFINAGIGVEIPEAEKVTYKVGDLIPTPMKNVFVKYNSAHEHDAIKGISFMQGLFNTILKSGNYEYLTPATYTTEMELPESVKDEYSKVVNVSKIDYTVFDDDNMMILATSAYDKYDLEGMVTTEDSIRCCANLTLVDKETGLYNFSVSNTATEHRMFWLNGGLVGEYSFVGYRDDEGRIVVNLSTSFTIKEAPHGNEGMITRTNFDTGKITFIGIDKIKNLKKADSCFMFNYNLVENTRFDFSIKHLPNDGVMIDITSAGHPDTLHIENAFISTMPSYKSIDVNVLLTEESISKFNGIEESIKNVGDLYGRVTPLSNEAYSLTVVCIEKSENKAHRFGLTYAKSANGFVPLMASDRNTIEIPGGMEIHDYVSAPPVTHVNDFMGDEVVNIHTTMFAKMPANLMIGSTFILDLIKNTIPFGVGVVALLPDTRDTSKPMKRELAFQYIENFLRYQSDKVVNRFNNNKMWDKTMVQTYMTDKNELISAVTTRNYGAGTTVVNFVSGSSIEENTNHITYQGVMTNRRTSETETGRKLTISNEVLLNGPFGRASTLSHGASVSMVTQSCNSTKEKVSGIEPISYDDKVALTNGNYDMLNTSYGPTTIKVMDPENSTYRIQRFAPNNELIGETFSTENEIYDFVEKESDVINGVERGKGFDFMDLIKRMQGSKE